MDRKQGFLRHKVLSKDIPITSLLAGLSDVALMVDTYVLARGSFLVRGDTAGIEEFA